MACQVVGGSNGIVSWSGVEDGEGHRTYKASFLVYGELTDGPNAAMNASGLPTFGSVWSIAADTDQWAYCTHTTSARRHAPPGKEDEKGRYWIVDKEFTTKPPMKKMCREQGFEDPLLEPHRISGSFSKYQEEATHDRFGQPIANSAFEQVRGPQAEFDASRTSVSISQNVADLQWYLIMSMNDTVNDRPLWGFPARFIKLTVGPWERKFHGTCNVYYTRQLEFEARWTKDKDGNVLSGWDRDVLDEGTKALNGHWNQDTDVWVIDNIGTPPITPDRNNPAHYRRYEDRYGNAATVILDGYGTPYNPAHPLQRVTAAYPHLLPSMGSGYQYGDILTVSGGTDIGAAVLVVAGVDSSGGVTAIAVDTPGAYSVVPANPATVTGGSGTGLTVDLIFAAIDRPGTRHFERYYESNFLLLGVPTTIGTPAG